MFAKTDFNTLLQLYSHGRIIWKATRLEIDPTARGKFADYCMNNRGDVAFTLQSNFWTRNYKTGEITKISSGKAGEDRRFHQVRIGSLRISTEAMDESGAIYAKAYYSNGENAIMRLTPPGKETVSKKSPASRRPTPIQKEEESDSFLYVWKTPIKKTMPNGWTIEEIVRINVPDEHYKFLDKKSRRMKTKDPYYSTIVNRTGDVLGMSAHFGHFGVRRAEVHYIDLQARSTKRLFKSVPKPGMIYSSYSRLGSMGFDGKNNIYEPVA